MPDSNPRSDNDADWENLLRQWRNQPDVQPRPFFYQRVRARLVAAEPVRPAWLPAWLHRPAYAALLALLGVALSGDCAPLSAARSAAPQAQPAAQRSAAPAR